MRIFSSLILIFIMYILPIILSLFAVIKISKMQSISKTNKIILSIIILLCIFIISNLIWRYQGDFETDIMIYVIFTILMDIWKMALMLLIMIWIIKSESINKIVKSILVTIILVYICVMLSNYINKIID